MRRWMKVVFCFLFGIIFTNMFTMDQAVADESFGKREISAESSVLTQKKQAVLDMETMTFSLESEADEDGDTISKGMILTTAGITSDTYPAVLTKSDEMFKKAAAISERSKVELTVGEEIYYGNYSTNYFDVNGKPAYCLEPLKDTPNSGSYETQALTGGAVRKGLYYAYGGPGYELYRAKYGAIGIGENYSVNDEYCMSHCILSYLYMGTEEAFLGLDQQVIENLKQKAKNIESMPDPPESFYAFLFNLNSAGQTMGGSGKDRVGSIEIYKYSDHPEWIEGNRCYSLAGAVFGIYESGKDKLLWELTTDESGYAKKENIPIGNYDIRELKAPAGHVIQFKPQSIRIDENKVCTYKCTDQAQYYPIDLILQKKDKETDQSEAQGAATLEDAQFSIKYYSGYYEKNPADSGVTPVREWIMKTDSEGRIRMKEEQKVSGDPFYKNTEGEVVLPLGTVTFQEIKAPEGYLLNNEIFIETVREEGTGQTDTIFQCPTIPDQIIRGNLQIVKFREDKEEESEQGEQKVPLEGIVFTITSKTTGWQCEIVTDENGMRITALAGDKVVYSQTYYSIGGGFIVDEEHFGQQNSAPVEVPYPYSSAADLQKHCQETGLSLSGLMMKNELALHSKEELEQHLANVWEVMRGGIERGISTEGVLPGKLRVPRRAAALRRMLVSQDKTTTDPMAVVDWINMFALAVNEENAAGGRVVTAPTNGACGIIPAVLAYYDKFIREVNANSLARYLLVASAIGSLYKMNASISGAEVGCQGEVGVACSMAAAGLAELLGASPAQVCIAAEIAMEHNLGLTCDPVAGQVQVPCIERNAIAAVKAVNAARMALRRTSEPRVCLDKVIETMYETGKDMNAKYRETSRGGLAMKIVACD